MFFLYFWHWCVIWDPGQGNCISALRIFHFWCKNEKMRVEKHWNVTYMIYGVYYGCFRLPSREGRAGSVGSFCWGGKKKSPQVTETQCSVLSLSLPLSVTFSFCLHPFPSDGPSPSSVPPLSTSVFSPFIPFVFLSAYCHRLCPLLSPVFNWAVRECCSECRYMGGLCQCRHRHFSSFPFVRWRFNPFLTLHFHMLRQQRSLVAFFLNEVFVTGK